MKKNIKTIFALSLAALVTGCSGNSVYNNYFSVQARGIERRYTYFRDNMETRFKGESISESITESEGVKKTTSVKYEYQIDTIDNVMHAVRTDMTKEEHTDNASLNKDEVEVSEIYLVYDYNRGLVVYGDSGEQKSTYVLHSNLDLYRQAKTAASSGDFEAYFGEATIENMASYNILDFFYSVNIDLSTEDMLDSFFDTSDINSYFSGCRIVEENYNAAANSRKFGLKVMAQKEVVSDETNDLTGTVTATIEAKINGSLIEKYVCEELFEGTVDSDPAPIPCKTIDTIRTNCSSCGKIKLADFSDYKPVVI